MTFALNWILHWKTSKSNWRKIMQWNSVVPSLQETSSSVWPHPRKYFKLCKQRPVYDHLASHWFCKWENKDERKEWHLKSNLLKNCWWYVSKLCLKILVWLFLVLCLRLHKKVSLFCTDPSWSQVSFSLHMKLLSSTPAFGGRSEECSAIMPSERAACCADKHRNLQKYCI